MSKFVSPREFPRRLPLIVGFGAALILAFVAGRLLAPSNSESSSGSEVAVSDSQPTGSAQSITATEAQLARVNKTLEATGTVSSFELIPVLSQATGRQIIQVLVDEGASVQRGQALAILDSAVLRAQLTQARADIAQAEARVAELRAGARTEELARAREAVRIAEAGVEQAQSDFELSQRRVKRNEFLQEEGAIARDRLDEVLNQARVNQANLEQAKARLQDAKETLAELQKGPRPEVITQAEAQLAQAKGQEQLILAQLKDTRVVAPRSGIIAERNARVGDVTSGSQRLFSIIENGRLELQLTVPETQLGQIRPGQPVRVTSDADANVKLVGRVRAIDPLVDEQSRQATVKVDLPPNSGLKPGMFLRGAIVTSAASGVTIPAAAALPQSDGSAVVFVIQSDNTVVEQNVTLGQVLSEDRVEIVEGVNPGDRVAVKGAPYLKEGDRVSIEEGVGSREE